MSFVNFRCYSHASFGLGLLTPDQLADYAKMHQLEAMALTDENNAHLAMQFAKKMRKVGTQPIVATSINFCQNLSSHQGNIVNKYDYNFAKITIIAKNKIGYQNLCSLISVLYANQKDLNILALDFPTLDKYKEGLIVLCGAKDGLIGHSLIQKNSEIAKTVANQFIETFKDDFFFEIQNHSSKNQPSLDNEIKYQNFILNFAYEKSIAVIASNRCCFLDASYTKSHQIMSAIINKRRADDETIASNENYRIKTEEEMQINFAANTLAVTNTAYLAKKITFALKVTTTASTPKFSNDENQALINLTETGLKERLLQTDKTHLKEVYQDRLNTELDTIIKLKYSGYFLIVKDFVDYAKNNEIPVGPGRGSAVGSLVSYVLGITDLDPIEYQLIFERFLNPARASPPDIDIDFCQVKRDLIIEYVVKKYGEKRVCHIITFGSLQARALIRDVGRVLGFNYFETDKLAKLLPDNPQTRAFSIKKLLNIDEQGQPLEKGNVVAKLLRDNFDNTPKVKELITSALKIEGLFRNASTHAAGLVIADQDLDKIIPLYFDSDAKLAISQFDMDSVKDSGLMKFDFLGLTTISIIQQTLELLAKDNINLDIKKIDFNDQEVYSMMTDGDLFGLFQMESDGMKSVIVELKPDRIQDIIAAIALFRPGPMQNIPSYIERKHNPSKRSYLHPLLKPILEETYGIPVYQEQVMFSAQAIANFSLTDADLLRNAMGKKLKSEMNKLKSAFIKGAKELNVEIQLANEIFQELEKFAGYGFNKSHAAAYAIICYQTAFLKKHYTCQFLTASMNFAINQTDRLSRFVLELKKLNIQIKPPAINLSDVYFKLDRKKNTKNNKFYPIVYSLAAIKGLGVNTANNIVNQRNLNGAYKSIDDMISRLCDVINHKSLEALIKAGALDEFSYPRHVLIKNIDYILGLAERYNKDKKSNQGSMFEQSTLKFKIDYHNEQKSLNSNHNFNQNILPQTLNNEKQVFGFFFSFHPTEKYKSLANLLHFRSIDDFHNNKEPKKNVLALIEKIVFIKDNRDNKLALITISDTNSQLSIRYIVKDNDNTLLKENKIYTFKLTKTFFQNNASRFNTTVANLCLLDSVVGKIKTVQISINKTKFDNKAFSEFYKGINTPGQTNICLQLNYNASKITYEVEGKVTMTAHQLLMLSLIEGIEDIRLI